LLSLFPVIDEGFQTSQHVTGEIMPISAAPAAPVPAPIQRNPEKVREKRAGLLREVQDEVTKYLGDGDKLSDRQKLFRLELYHQLWAEGMRVDRVSHDRDKLLRTLVP